MPSRDLCHDTFKSRFNRIGGQLILHDGQDFTEPPDHLTLRVQALKSLLVEKGVGDPAVFDEIIKTYE